MPTIADIVREHGGAYLERFGDRVLPSHRQAVLDIAGCRTPAMGGHLLGCDDCGHREFVYHSCRNRACPQCHSQHTETWLAARAHELLPVRYHHVVFTLPADLRDAARTRQRDVLGALMLTAAEALQTLAADPRYAGGQLGVLAVLHTWTRALIWHPHVHCLVPGVAVTGDREVWRPSERFLVPVKALSVIFRARLVSRLRHLRPAVHVPGTVWRQPWVVFARPCVEGSERVLQYLARYAFRGPLSDRRILGAHSGRVTFGYTDGRSGQPRSVTVTGEEFLRRYLQHVLPEGFQRVRYYGLWSPSRRRDLRSLQAILPIPATGRTPALVVRPSRPAKPVVCPHCGSPRWYRRGRLAPVPAPWPAPSRGPPP